MRLMYPTLETTMPIDKLTAETITDSQIRALGIEALEHNDTAMFDITTAALDGDAGNPHVCAARKSCADAINAARGADDSAAEVRL